MLDKRIEKVCDKHKPLGEPEYIYVNFWERSWGNKIARIIYSICKIVYVTLWFYFIPFTSIYLSYYIPKRFGEIE